VLGTPGLDEPPACRKVVIVRCDQPRALDLGTRNGRKLESVPDAIMDEVLARLAPILE
jgi:mRNA-degrading endonuclease toxin of MazEF toxin-antitoxin module